MSLKPHPGFYGWQLLPALWVIYVTIVGFTFYGVPVLFPYMIADLGWSRTQISAGMMTALLTMGMGAPISSWSINRFGARITIIFGSIYCACGLFAMQFASTFPQYILFFGIIAGSGIAFSTNIPVQTIITFWFKRRRGLAFGLVLAGGAMGGFFAPIVINQVIAWADGNWRLGWAAMAGMVLIAMLMALTFVRNKPSDLGQFPDGIEPEEATPKSAEPTGIHRSQTDWKLREALRTHQLWLLILSVIGGQFIWQILVSQGPLHLADRGFTAAQYGLIYGSTIGISIIGRLGAGFFVDRIDPQKVFIAGLFFAGTGSVLFWFVNPASTLTLVYPAFSGIGLGTLTVALPNLVANYWGEGAFASVNGVIFPIMIAFNSSAPILAGFLYDMSGSYLPIMTIAWVLLAGALAAMICISPPLITHNQE